MEKNNQEGSRGAESDSANEIKIARVIALKKELDARKELFKELDALIGELAAQGFDRAEVDGMVVTLKDNFAEKNTSWTAAAVRRFEIEVEPIGAEPKKRRKS